jgi:hypothetical protein
MDEWILRRSQSCKPILNQWMNDFKPMDEWILSRSQSCEPLLNQ